MNARQLLEWVIAETGDDEIAVSVVTVLELAHGLTHPSGVRIATAFSPN